MPQKYRAYDLDVEDPLRLDLNSYWVRGESAFQTLGPPTLMNPSYSEAKIEISSGSFYKKRQSIKVTKSNTFDVAQQSLFVGTATSSATSFQEYVESRFVPYFNSHNSVAVANKDNAFDISAPAVVKDFSNNSDPTLGVSEVKQEFLINFLEKNYEDAIAINSVSELSLPNFYEVMKVGGNPPQDSYFDDYAKSIPPSDNKYENIMISMDNYKEMKRMNGFDKVFPLEIKLSPYNPVAPRNTGFHDALDSSNLDLTLMDLMSRRKDIQHVGPTVFNAYPYNMTEYQFLLDGPQSFADSVNLESLDMLAWARDISDVINSLVDISPTSNKVYLGSDNQSIDIAKGKMGLLKEVLSSAMFLGKVKDLIRDNLRSFEDINKGMKSYSEIVFYKVEKYTSPDAPTPIQNIWIPNIDEIDPIEYVDTQVKYNKSYTYKVHAFSAVIGTKYYYDTSKFRDSFFTPDTSRLPSKKPATSTFDPTSGFSTTSGPTAAFKKPGSSTYDPSLGLPSTSGPNLSSGLTATAGSDLSTDVVTTDESIGGGHGFDPTGQKKKALEGKKPGSSTFDPSLGLPNTNGPSSWTDLVGTKVSPDFFQIDVITEPTVDLIKTELFNFQGSILDDPPMIPDVKFTSYIGIDNRITINMHAQIGEYKDEPVILSSEESDYIDSLRVARGLPTDSLITYRTDDETKSFEIYRMETMPVTYEDFSDKLVKNVSTSLKTTASHKDKIIPNMDYYYMVRSVDIHDHKSYPSPVYKVRMVNDSGAIYPLVDIIEMRKPEKPRMKTKKFKKFIQLIPALPQTLLDYEASGLVTASGKVVDSALGKEALITLGADSPRLFGETPSGHVFKIRLISKNTGKKIDLNVTFKVENEL